MKRGRINSDAGEDAANVAEDLQYSADIALPWPLTGRPKNGAVAMLMSLADGDDVAMPLRMRPGNGLASGDAGIASGHGTWIVCADARIEASDAVKAPGYRCGDDAGVSGTLTITDADGWSVTLRVKGGLVVAVVASGTAVWTPEG